MATAKEDAAAHALAAASASRRRGRRRLGWAAVLCFGSRGARGEDALVPGASRARRKKRTVPVDGEVVARPADCEARRGRGADDDEEVGKGTRALGCCCFLPMPRVPARRQDSTMESGGSNTNRKRLQHEHTKRHPKEDEDPPETRQVEARSTTGSVAEARLPTTPGDAATTTQNGGGGRGTKTTMAGGGAGAFGSTVGLCVVAAVSMAGLLGGRLWAVACVCAWLVALSRLRQRRRAQASAGGN
ncbi:hypothetical protein QOZ80_2BG0184050 [Eleusine coracana subsp. coracana]|nr:hypothetical protein QOZ80_2BG0184050 [Eleusine coracana subsp. coracana]